MTSEAADSIRLIRKFFPESKPWLLEHSEHVPLHALVQFAGEAGLERDYSCDPFGVPPGFRGSLCSKGGFEGETDSEIYLRLLKHTDFSPSGRVVVVPDSGCNLHGTFVCDSRVLPQRLDEFEETFFNGTNDGMFVFESGEAIAFDHDQRLFWAKSRLRRVNR